MRQLRKEDLSLFRYIKDTVLRDFVEKEEMVPLELISELSCDGGYVYEAQSDMVPLPTERGRGWVFFDCPQYDAYGDCIYVTDSCVPEFTTVTGTDAAGMCRCAIESGGQVGRNRFLLRRASEA